MKYEPRPIGIQYTEMIAPSEQIASSDFDGSWIACTHEIISHEPAWNLIKEITKIVKVQKIRRHVQHCRCCGSLLE